MRVIFQFWYRWIDRELDRSVELPERETMEAGDWNALVGQSGERVAAKHLWRTGRKVIYRNFKPREGGEVDIVYREGDLLVFGEVKTRTRGEFGDPARAVDRAKEKLVIRGANAWLRELNHPEVVFRFDIIEVLLKPGERPAIGVIENAFTTPQTGLGM
ncbi:MAG: YraN family protein [Verrucomicrobiae bacterium]|nr:YraN family protein [Verrucomicrobiae bacterium]